MKTEEQINRTNFLLNLNGTFCVCDTSCTETLSGNKIETLKNINMRANNKNAVGIPKLSMLQPIRSPPKSVAKILLNPNQPKFFCQIDFCRIMSCKNCIGVDVGC